MFRRLMREPLLHFLLLGLLLFLMFHVVSGRRGGADRRIVINDATVASLVQSYQGIWQRPPTSTELKGLIDNRVREEILYREGVAMGLDRDDSVVRRRVLQKLDVITEEPLSQTAPSDTVLAAWLQKNAARYAQPAVLDFEQVLFDPVRRGSRLKTDVTATLARLQAGADPATLGDRSLLPVRVHASPADQVARDFGEPFTRALIEIPIGEWRGPVTSGYGVHLVRVSHRTPGRPVSLPEVRAAVERDWESEGRAQAKEDYYRKLRQDYTVVFEAKLPAGAQPKAD